MLFGVCRGDKDFETLKFIKDTGYDYVECNFGDLSRMDDEKFEEYKNNLQAAGIPCMAANCFIPGEFKVSSNELDEKTVSDHIEKGMKRGSEIGLKTVVFGSGGARSLPDGQPYHKGFLRIGYFLKNIVKPIAEKYNITLVIEPLRLVECNIINTIKEGAMLAALGESENIGVLGDIYHMVAGNDSISNIYDLKGSFKHAHISYPYESDGLKRRYPTDINGYDYKTFIDALKAVECQTCSIEAGTENFKEDAKKAINVLKECSK